MMEPGYRELNVGDARPIGFQWRHRTEPADEFEYDWEDGLPSLFDKIITKQNYLYNEYRTPILLTN